MMVLCCSLKCNGALHANIGDEMDQKLLELLVCPICKGPIIYQKSGAELICKVDRLAFPIRDGIPVMLEDDARRLSLEDVDRL